MIKSKKIEKLDGSRVRLYVTIGSDDAQTEYEKVLKKYTKEAQIKGFRPGKVPVQIVEQRFGEALRANTAENLIKESLNVVYDEIDEKPLSFEPPLLESELKFSPGEDLLYTVSYDVLPKVDITKLTGFSIEKPQVDIDKKAVQDELERLQQQNAIFIDQSSVEKDNIITIDYCELDSEGMEITSSRREDYSFTIGSKQAPYNLNDDDFIGINLGQTLEKKASLGEKTPVQKTIRITVKKIRSRELPQIDDELAQDIDEKYKNLADLKKDVNEQLKKSRDAHIKRALKESLIHKIIEANPITLPESMIQAELKGRWENLMKNFGNNEKALLEMLQLQKRSKDDLYTEWRPNTEIVLKSQLIIQKLIEERSMSVSKEELASEFRELAPRHNMNEDDLRKYYEENKMIEYLKHDIMETRLVDQLLEENTITKGKRIQYSDFMQ